MCISEKTQHCLLLLITAGVFIILSAGLAESGGSDTETTLITTVT